MNNSSLGWTLVAVALVILAAEGDFGLLAVLIPVSMILAGVVWLASSRTQLTEHREKR